ADVTDGLCATPGATTVVFVAVKVAVARVSVHGDGHSVVHGSQIAVAGAPRTAGPAALRLAPDATPPLGEAAPTDGHRGDLAGQVFAYERRAGGTAAGAREMRLEVSAAGLEATVAVGISLTRPVTVATDLVGGHDYELYEPAQGYGTVWRIH